MLAYIVYEDFQDDRIFPEEAEFYLNKEDAITRANQIKDELQYDDNYKLVDEFDAEEITDTGNVITFENKSTGMECLVVISTIKLRKSL